LHQSMKILVVTAALAVTGAVIGAVVGSLMLLSWAAVVEASLRAAWDPALLAVGAAFGGMFGAVLGPAAAWLLMRHVPLWLAVGGTAAGTLMGAVIGMIVAGPPGSFYGALAGFVGTAVFLRVRRRRLLRAGASGPGAPRPT
jgi:hypothetical protein